MMDSGIPVTEWHRRLAALPKDGKPPFSMGISYVGSLDLPPEYATLVTHITRRPYIRAALGNFGNLNTASYGDTLYLSLPQRFESDAIAQGLRTAFAEMGIPSTMRVWGKYVGNQVVLDALPVI